jgi:mannose-6-phosphate isomerase-like protein (cupin superfamily)
MSRRGRLRVLTSMEETVGGTNADGPDLHAPYTLPVDADYISPGGIAEIREMHRIRAGEIAHARVPAGKVSDTAWFDGRTEIFYVHAGRGQMWIDDGTSPLIVDLIPGRSVLVPAGARFQYRSGLCDELTLLLAVLPRWRDSYHRAATCGPWPPSSGDGAAGPDRSDPKGPTAGPVVVRELAWVADDAAPDGSEIRLLPWADAGGLCHCLLHPGQRSRAVAHRTVTEIWFALDGTGELARWDSGRDEKPAVLPLRHGVSVVIPVCTPFQFRATGIAPLRLLLLTIPRWPGDEEADRSVGHLDAWLPQTPGP